jgi:NAD+ kinase
MKKIKRVGFVIKPHAPEVGRVLGELIAYCESRGIACVLEKPAAARAGRRREGIPREKVPARSDLVIVLGGDGTLLSIAYLAAEAGVPVMGVNMGRLGFLTEVPLEEAIMTLEAFLKGRKNVLTPRRMLEARHKRSSSYCLNDLVITKGALARMIEFTVWIDAKEVATIKADGLVIATATGSTAYSLSAGGPIIQPRIGAAVITPICPHALAFRPLVISARSTVKVKLLTRGEKVFYTLDGQRGGIMERNDTITVKPAPVDLLLVTSPRRNFFDLVKEKLGWAIGPRGWSSGERLAIDKHRDGR